MALLRAVSVNLQISLGSTNLVGRSPSAVVCLSDRRVSNEHAKLSWSGLHWQLRDLGSYNGTRLNGKSLSPGTPVMVARNDVLEFGSPDARWTLADDGPPVPWARSLRDEHVIAVRDGWLLLPDAERPSASVIARADRTWELEAGGVRRSVADQETIEVLGESFQLFLPHIEDAEPTSTHEPRLRLCDVSAEFEVSPDEEHVDVWVRSVHRTLKLPPRAYHYMLLTLARQRLQDRAASCAESEAGWVHIEALAHALRTDVEKLNVDIFRARKQWLDTGVLDAQGLVERRPETRAVRLGLQHVEVRRAHAHC